MRHGYTNRTDARDGIVAKSYDGPDPAMRRARESAMLAYLAGRFPVPPLRGAVDGELHTGLVGGTHGQDLLAAGHGEAVLRTCGSLLARLQAIDPVDVPAVIDRHDGPVPVDRPDRPDRPVRHDSVLVHGDFGPNNLLLDPRTFEPTALVDWEWAHLGAPIEDLAGCELIVRMHHPGHVMDLDAFFAAFGWRPAWADRQAAMLARCEELVRFCERWDDGGAGAGMWRERVATTASWTE